MNKKYYMEAALREARLALAAGEVPIGAVIVLDGEIIGRGHNMVEAQHSVLYHAELVALREASAATGRFALEGAELYVTVEPCLMCAGAILQSRIARVIYGTAEPRTGAIESVIEAYAFNFPHQVKTEGGVLENEAQSLLKDFFTSIREK